ncbi:MAG: insulinase family protein [Cyclobacteriaceae bacterium]|nr:insulinase family protein [Cyclobacteriaceae bacterium]
MKRIIGISFIYLLVFTLWSCSDRDEQEYVSKQETEDGYSYTYVTGDPMDTRIYTLENGLKIYLSRYTDAPRIQVLVPVKAGGKFDPAENTGLAHYLEHMMFKGNDQFGSLDWPAEKVLLDSIENMFNHYSTLTNADERKAYYALIDEVSSKAAELAIPNEMDKMMALIGAEDLNAYTTEDRTVYMVDIPSNELERYLKIESTRFRKIVNRLFHTELETVYEEKNRSLDNDYWKAYETLFASLFTHHPYGTQTVIGTIEHLKNPSITEIVNYYNKYYVPNNIAICMSGDLQYQETISLIDKYFGSWEPGEFEPVEFAEEPPITAPVERTVFGPDAEFLYMGFRFDGYSSRDFMLMRLVDMILNNAEAGLIDINLKQQQKVLDAGCSPYGMNDYSIHIFNGRPKDGQSLEELKDLILEQIDLVKKGEFEDWLLEAVITDFKKSEMRQLESNYARAENMVMAFTYGMDWADYISGLDEMESVTREEIIAFANEKYGKNYAVVYKRTGEDPNKQRVDKPQITKVPLNRDERSIFHQEIASMEPEKLEPVYVDFDRDINKSGIQQDIKVLSKVNEENELFNLNYLLDIGSNNDPKLNMAVSYLEFLGTEELPADAFKKELYKLGCSFSVNTSPDRIYVSLSGLDENMEQAMDLFEKLLNDPKPDQEALDLLVGRTLKARSDAMKNKGAILWRGLYSYARYGEDSPFTNVLSNDELGDLKAEELTEIIRNLTTMEHRILYYGPREMDELTEILNDHHILPGAIRPLPEKIDFPEKSTEEPYVYWTDYDMVQTEFIMISRGSSFDPGIVPEARLFNEYFGGGMNSVVFQEIREAQGLAYSAYSNYSLAGKKGRSNYLFAYIGTQADKQPEAMEAMLDLLNNLPESEEAFQIARESILSKIESERITKSSILWSYESAKDLGLNYDLRRDVYEKVNTMTFTDLKEFHKKYIQDQPFVTVLIGSRDNIDFQELKKYGKIRELSLSELFGYEEVRELMLEM